MDGYKMEVFAESRRQGLLDEVERRRLLRAGAPEPMRSGRRNAWWPFAIVHKLARVAEAW